MILTVTLNPALDVTYRVPALVPHASHRVTAVAERSGGKGLNVSGVLADLGVGTTVTGLVGGRTGALLRADLDARGIAQELVEVPGETRRTLTVVDEEQGDATVFNEPGPPVAEPDWQAFLDGLPELVRMTGAHVVVASGSRPPGIPVSAYADLTLAARRAGALVVVDTSGEALLEALPVHPDVVKPNRDELHEVTGEHDPLAGAAALQARGALDVVVSLGAEGILRRGPRGTGTRAWLREPLSGNPTGAGDAAVAAVAAGMSRLAGWTEILSDAVAWSGAAVLQPLAGSVDPADVARLHELVETEEVSGAGNPA